MSKSNLNGMKFRKNGLGLLGTILWLVILLPSTAWSNESLVSKLLTKQAPQYQLIRIGEVSLGWNLFQPGGVDPLINYSGLEGKEPGQQLDLNINMDLLGVLYFNNVVHSMIDRDIGGSDGQFRTVGWHFQWGIHLSQYLDIYYEHFSQHLLDTTYQFGHFPSVNSIGAKVFFYRDVPQKDTVF